MTRTAWLGLVAILCVASVLMADPAVVRTRDGASFEGEVVDGPASVTVTIRGVETVIPKTEVVSIDPVGNFDQELIARVQKLEPRDVAGRVALAREAFDRRRYDLARQVLEAALAIDPNSREAGAMLELVNSQLRMERAKAESIIMPTPQPQVTSTAPQAVDRRLLTPADVEAIRRKELKITDLSVRLRFNGDVKKRFADSQNVPFATFNMLTPVEQALLILERGDATMQANMRILTDPESILTYRRQVQPLVLQSCATTGCHGTGAGGGFMLFTSAENDLVTYTNFYILQSYKKADDNVRGVFAQRVQKLINRGHGEQSLIASFGLPPAIGEYDHPLVRGRAIPPIFRNQDDLRYRMIVSWMNTSLNAFEPDYGIVYTPPMPTTVPAR